MRKLFTLCTLLVAALAFAGCGRDKVGESQEKTIPETPKAAEKAEGDENLEPADEPLDVENEKTPEGVVNGFFRTFFQGDSDGAFAFLSDRARDAQSENFVAQASDTIRWRVVEKTKPTSSGLVYVWVEVEDFADSGDVQRDTLSFKTVKNKDEWRVCGFNVGDATVDFEEAVIVAREAPEAPSARTANRSEGTTTR